MRVPDAQRTPVEVRVEFDSGPLGGVLTATQPVRVNSPTRAQ